jgi:uncharacterized membrane protein
MNALLWTLQILLALHTVIGAFWKLSHSAQTIPTLQAIPHGAWLAMIVFELLCSIGLLLPALRPRSAFLAQLAALCIAAEMLLFCALHVRAGSGWDSQMIYWTAVATVCAVIAIGRWMRRPL